MTTYREAGVDIDAGDETIRRIKPILRSTFTPGVLADVGSFGAFFELDVNRYRQPVLVSSVDGVGTKLKVAFSMNRHHTVGRDLVNHCVNDVAVCGAVPLFFLDYFSTGRLDPSVAADVIRGFAEACKENGCALIGGETAEMPDLYAPGEYDLAGTIVGVAEKDAIVDGRSIREDDLLVGFPSSGLHTNGYSLARKVLFEHFDVHDAPDELNGRSVGDVMLDVHRSYLSPIRLLIEAGYDAGFVHVTGGGIPGNTVRVIPKGLTFDVDYAAWERPRIFDLIQRIGAVPEEDMRRTFNLGIGLIAVIPPDQVDVVVGLLEGAGERPSVIGRIRADS